MVHSNQPPEETFDELYEHAPCGYLTADRDGFIIRINATLLGWLGTSRDEALGRRIQSLLSPAGRVFFETHVAPALAITGVARQVAIDLRGAGKTRLAALTDWRQIEVDGVPCGTRLMVVDASERRAYERDLITAREEAKQTAERLVESEARLRDSNEALAQRVVERTTALRASENLARLALSAVGGVGVWTYDIVADRFFYDANIAAIYDIDAANGEAGISRDRFLANVHEEDRAELRKVMASGLSNAGDVELEYRLVHADGSIHWVLSRGHTYFDAAGQAIRRTGVGVDMTSQRETEQQLRQAQKMEAVGQLTGGIAHDFNNLLQGITGSLDIIETRIASGRHTDLERWLAGAKTSARRAAALTHRLLAFSRRQPISPRTVEANPLVLSMKELLRRTLGEQIMLEMNLADDLWPTRCDSNQLESALLNLAINARDAMPTGGKLRIATRNVDLREQRVANIQGATAGEYVCVSVTDTGIGMSDDTIAKAFEPFFTTKALGQGTGLGLSMIYGFARQSDGHVQITSELDHGSTISIYLPRLLDTYEDVPKSSEAEPSGKRWLRNGKVLIIEDEPVVRELVVEVVNELGFATVEAADGQSGLDLIRRPGKLDLLITDIGLPGLNGRQVADAARLIRPELKILFMTGYAQNAAGSSGFIQQGMALITKPFPNEGLADSIHRLLDEQRV